MTAEDIARQHRAALGFVHTQAARRRGELIELTSDGGANVTAFVDYHVRKDGQITIYAAAVSKDEQGKGWGASLLDHLWIRYYSPLTAYYGRREITCIVARCPADLPSNGFWLHMGFELIGTSPADGKRRAINTYRLELGGK